MKSNLVINLVSSNFELDHKTFLVMFWFLTEEIALTTKNYFRKIKKYFNFSGLGKILSYAINQTGTIKFYVHYQYNRKTNQIDIHLCQKPLVIDFFSTDNKKRFLEEKHFELQTESQKLVSYIKKEFSEKVKKYRRIFLDKIENEIDSIVLANETWKTLKIFK